MLHFKIYLTICLIYLITPNKIDARPIQEITETRNPPETQIPEGFSQATNDELKPSEVQKAVCTVTSGDVRASAEAFTTRELKGVCGSTEMQKSFNDLEQRLSQELQNIQKLIQDLHRQFVTKGAEEQNHSRERPVEPVTSSAGIVSPNMNVTPSPAFKFQPIPNIENKQQKSNEISKNYYQTPRLKSLQTQNKTGQEVSKYNNTLIANKDVKVYSYYWRMENFTQNIKTGNRLTMESPIFSIRGKALKIKAYFQHLHRDFLYLQLEDYSASPELGLGNSIILDTGSIFKEIKTEHFRYKMSILDQNKRSSDLVSQEFDNHDTGFSIPNSALIDSPFIKDDSLLIQLFLYL